MKKVELIEIRKYKDEDVPLLTIKKGTVLFRTVVEEKVLISDYLGIKTSEENSNYCLPSNYNVFFFTCPYVFDINKFHRKDAEGKTPTIALYVILKDLKVALMVKPSKLIRANEGKDNIISTSCVNFTFCDGLKGRNYDPCFYEEFMKENPDVVGSYSIQPSDTYPFLKKLKTKVYNPFRKFISLVKDEKYYGSPELMLYPKRIRSLDDINTNLEEIDLQSFITNGDFNYYPIATYFHKPLDASDELYISLQKLISPEGLRIDGEQLHMTIDKRTYFYTIYESVESQDMKYLVPLKEKKKLSLLQKTNKDFIFSHARIK
jgi:hypothetical protein